LAIWALLYSLVSFRIGFPIATKQAAGIVIATVLNLQLTWEELGSYSTKYSEK
jgi:hypothetical protein